MLNFVSEHLNMPKKSKSSEQIPSQVLTRPFSAEGTFWRIITVNDVYKLPCYAHVASAVGAAKQAAEGLDCVVTSHMNGDFMSPSTFTAMDNGITLTQAMNYGKIDYASLGNHEYDIGTDNQALRLREFKGTILNSNVDDEQLSEFATYKIIEIGDKKAVLGGYLTPDTSIYRPSSMPKANAISEACVATWEAAKQELGTTPDLFMPMTHQLLHEDRETAEFLAKNDELEKACPIILGGHEHELYIEEAEKAVIVKMGVDAKLIGVIDIWWTKDGEMKTQITSIPACEFPMEPKAESWALQKEATLAEMMNVGLTTLPSACSSNGVRMGESQLASFLMDKVKKGFRKDKVELTFITGGAIRAQKDYEAGPFNFGDLFAEMPFDCLFWIQDVPGHVIADSIAATRGAAKPNPAFVHLDSDCMVKVKDGEHVLTEVDGKAFDPNRTYKIATIRVLYAGLNNLEPFRSWVIENMTLPSEEACIPGKDIIIETCMKENWRNALDFKYFDKDGDGDVSQDELAAGLDAKISAMDKNGDGHIDQAELQTFMSDAGSDAIAKMIGALDADGNGMISKQELMDLAF